MDPDLVFNESMINSLSKFGVTDNIFFAGVRLQYHWLSFAWEATLGSLRELQPFAVSGVAAPIFTYLVVLSLVFAIVDYFSKSSFAAMFAVLIFAMVSGHQIPLFQVFNPYSFSSNFSLIFVFAFVFLLATSKLQFSASLTLLSVLMTVTAVGSKLSTFPMFVFGFGAMLVFAFRKPELFRAISRLAIFSAIGVFGFWFFLFRAENSAHADGFRIAFGEIFIQKANLFWGGSIHELSIGFVAVFVAIIYPLSGLVTLRQESSNHLVIVRFFVLCGGFGSLVLAAVLTDDFESGTYFIGHGLALILPFAIVSLSIWVREVGSYCKGLVVLSAILGLASAFVWIDLFEGLGWSKNNQLKESLFMAIPLLVALTVFANSKVFQIKNRTSVSAGLFALVVTAAASGSFLANSSDLYALGVDNRTGYDDVSLQLTGSIEYRAMLLWLKTHSKEDDLVASNRQCLTVEINPSRCDALWSLVSAISKRQNLVEGGHPPRTQHLASERERRWGAVIEFVNSPNETNYWLLSSYGVKWVVADHAITFRRDWEPFATQRFSNQAGSILELRPND